MASTSHVLEVLRERGSASCSGAAPIAAYATTLRNATTAVPSQGPVLFLAP